MVKKVAHNLSATTLLLHEDTPRSGEWNMAVDEALLNAAVSDGVCSVRLYRWATPTLSIGYFQEIPSSPELGALAELPVVQRLSGGGAILHDHEWTYSCCIPKTHEFAKRPIELYSEVHRRLIAVLERHGVDCGMRGVCDHDSKKTFLCFSRFDPRDIVMGDQKILGSAQRRRRGAILQHGSLVLRASAYAPQYPGVYDLADVDIAEDELGSRLFESLRSLMPNDNVAHELPRSMQPQDER